MPSLRIKIGNVSILILLATPTKLLLLLEQSFPGCIAWPACSPACPVGQCASHVRVPPPLWACQTPCRNPRSARWSAHPRFSSVPGLRLRRHPCPSLLRLLHGCQTPQPPIETKCPLTACARSCGLHRKAQRYFPAASGGLLCGDLPGKSIRVLQSAGLQTALLSRRWRKTRPGAAQTFP